MQDSDADWKAEAALMSKVYENCALNIAAEPAVADQHQGDNIFSETLMTMLTIEI
jgi:hypothetical protein